MKPGQFYLLLLFGILLSSCKFECSVGNDDNKTTTTKKHDLPKTSNGIQFSATNVFVNQAYLAYPDGRTVPADNKIPLGERILLVINCDGWKEENGKTFIGASEVIETDNGTHILSSGDLFEKYNEGGVDPGDAKVVSLAARITEQYGPIKYYITTFRVWDKKGTGEITGSYKFYIK